MKKPNYTIKKYTELYNEEIQLDNEEIHPITQETQLHHEEIHPISPIKQQRNTIN